MKAAFFDLEDWELPIIEAKFKNTGLSLLNAEADLLDKSKLDLIKDGEILSVAYSKVDKDIIDALPNLKLISARTTGFDNIDTAYAKEKGIAVINVPAYGDETVAEYAFALILTLSRKMSMTFLRSLLGIFDQKMVRGNELAGKTLGVVGTGKIGRKLVKMAFGFDLNIICYDPFPNQEIVEKYNVKYVSLEELFKNTDIISIHVPYMKETHHLISFDTLKILKKGVLLVNTSRGPIVNTSAVLEGVKEGVFGGVALDTFEGEQIWVKEENIIAKSEIPPAEEFKKALESFYLLRFRNVVLTPHNAFNSHEAVRRIIEAALSDMVVFGEKGNCEHRVV